MDKSEDEENIDIDIDQDVTHVYCDDSTFVSLNGDYAISKKGKMIVNCTNINNNEVVLLSDNDEESVTVLEDDDDFANFSDNGKEFVNLNDDCKQIVRIKDSTEECVSLNDDSDECEMLNSKDNDDFVDSSDNSKELENLYSKEILMLSDSDEECVMLNDEKCLNNFEEVIINENSKVKDELIVNHEKFIYHDEELATLNFKNEALVKTEHILVEIEQCIDHEKPNDQECAAINIYDAKFTVTDESVTVNNNTDNFQKDNETNYLNVKPVRCEFCSYKCIGTAALIKHHTVIHKDHQLACDKCNYKTTDKSMLEAHILAVHTVLKPLSCDLCRYKCIEKSWLKKHMKSHNIKYKCSVCSTHCVSINALRMHKRTGHWKRIS